VSAVARRFDGTVTIDVLDSGSVVAYAFAGGKVYLTRGLLEILTNHEVAAAGPHEIGHLLGDGHIRGVASLAGQWQDREIYADMLGCRLLESQGIPAQAMISMLGKVRSAQRTGDGCRSRLGNRIELLTSVYYPKSIRKSAGKSGRKSARDAARRLGWGLHR
jgi:predicted Zn-dependent protease